MFILAKKHLFYFCILTLLVCLALFSCGSDTAGNAGGKTITLDALKSSLPANQITVGLDIDDTVLFSTPGFTYGATNTDGPNGTNKYGTDYENNPQFLKDMNQIHDKYSIPKESGRALLSMHNTRGDSIFFITKRTCTGDDAQVMQNRMNTVFQLTGSTLLCTNGGSKTPQIESNNVDIYYGDSDSDMQYALAAQVKKVRPVRVLRSAMSENKPIPANGYNPGSFGEEIIVNSEN